jgi:predicted ATPase
VSELIDEIALTNYRSIISCQAKFSPLTILIGANGSGKSNIIKALEFMSDIAQNGLQEAVSQRGGFYELLPKALPDSLRWKSRVSIRLSSKVQLRDLECPPVHTDHLIELGRSSKSVVRVCSESLKFAKALESMQYVIKQALQDAPDEDRDRLLLNPLPESAFSFTRTDKGRVKIDLVPDISPSTMLHTRLWFGVPPSKQKGNRLKSLHEFLQSRLAAVNRTDDIEVKGFKSRGFRPNTVCFIDPLFLSRFGIPPLYTYQSMLTAVRRYELLLNELRSPQQRGAYERISSEGRHMPAAIDRLRRDDNDSWQHIVNTLSKIAPHVMSTNIQKLRGGTQFVEFLEQSTAQPVESWEASDGTLRTLAILIALEVHPLGGTILIEEPELGLHPWAVEYLMEHIQALIERRKIQVIMTTHSTQVLNSVSTEQVIVAQRTPTKGTKLVPLEDIVDAASVGRGDIGRMWEKGMLGGVPDAYYE